MVEPLVINPYDIDGRRVLSVAGEIDLATSHLVAEVLEQCDGLPVCVDLTNVTFIDSSGLAVLFNAHKRAEEQSTEFTVANAAPNVQKVFDITKLDHVLNEAC